MKNINLMSVAIGVAVGVVVYRAAKGKNGGFSNASGSMMQCMCKMKSGAYRTRNCRRKQHEDCTSCCDFHGGVSHNEPI